MKRLLVICDGMADEEIPSLKGTPLDLAGTPAMDYLASNGRSGLITTIPEGVYPGSENGILTILGYHRDELPAGRGPLEALGLGIDIAKGEAAGRYTLRESGVLSRIENSFPQLRFRPFTESGGLVIGPNTVLKEMEALARDHADLKIWSVAEIIRLRPLKEIRNHKGGGGKVCHPIIICYVPLLRGIAKATGTECFIPEGATGTDHTDYRSIAYQMTASLETHDFVVVHIEACDYLSHQLDSLGKIRAIEKIDRYIIAPALEKAKKDKDLAIIILPDHYSISSTGRHGTRPVPALLYYKNIEPDESRYFSEKEAANGSLRNIEDLYG